VQQHVVGVVIETRAFLQVRVMTRQTAIEIALGDLWTPDWEKTVALGVGVVQQSTLPLITTSGRPERISTWDEKETSLLLPYPHRDEEVELTTRMPSDSRSAPR